MASRKFYPSFGKTTKREVPNLSMYNKNFEGMLLCNLQFVIME